MLGKIKQDEREGTPDRAIFERVVWVTLSNKLKNTGHVEEHGRWTSRCKGPESDRRPSVLKNRYCRTS